MSEPVRAPVATLDWLPPRVAAAAARASTPPCASSSAPASARCVTPTFEDTALFARTSGDASDVVSKEMYSFTRPRRAVS